MVENETEEADVDSADEDEESSEVDEDETEDLSYSEEINESVDPVVNYDIRGAINKVIKIVNFFRKSPKALESLHKRTKEDPEIGEELGLIKQCKTRW